MSITQYQSDSAQLPRVVVCYLSENAPLQQTYSNIEYTKCKDVDNFNDVLNSGLDNEVYVFLSAHDDFWNEECVARVIDKRNKCPNACMLYTDNVTIKNNIQFIQYFPTFSYEHTQIPDLIINTPLFICKDTGARFNTDLQFLFLYEMFHQIRQKGLVVHIPSILTKTTQPHDISYEQDFALLNEQPV